MEDRAFLVELLVADPGEGEVGQVVECAPDGDAVFIVLLIPVSAPKVLEQAQGFAIGQLPFGVFTIGIDGFLDELVTVQTFHLLLVGVVIRGDDEVGDVLELVLALFLTQDGILIIVIDLQFPFAPIDIGIVGPVDPFEDGRGARLVSDHVMEAGIGGIMEVVLLDQFDSFLNRVGVIKDEPEHGGRGDVGLIGLLIRRDGGVARALIGHINAARDSGVIDAI